MKTLKKVLIGIMVITTLSCTISTQINSNAMYIGKSEDYIDSDFIKYLQEVAVRKAIIIVEDDGEIPLRYYLNLDEGIYSPMEIDDDFDVSKVENTIILNKNESYFYVDESDLYSIYEYDYDLHIFVSPDSVILKSSLGDSEDSITEFTVGDSVYPRGDINLDGKTNTADLLYLKKYLLGLIEW
ncbi:MAG: hypothetical protein LUG94_00335 [Ruminococcus sp.]|nr:hypothetical protein [Ruminococcus sp.]